MVEAMFIWLLPFKFEDAEKNGENIFLFFYFSKYALSVQMWASKSQLSFGGEKQTNTQTDEQTEKYRKIEYGKEKKPDK